MSQASKVLKDAGSLSCSKLAVGSAQTIVGGGVGAGKQPISLNTVVTLLDNNAAADLTLEAGVPGQMKILSCIDDQAAAVLDNADVSGGLNPTTTLTFDTAGDSAILVYDGTRWNVVSNNIA